MRLKFYFMWWLLINFFTKEAIDLAKALKLYYEDDLFFIYGFILVLSGGNVDNIKGVRKLALEELNFDYKDAKNV